MACELQIRNSHERVKIRSGGIIISRRSSLVARHQACPGGGPNRREGAAERLDRMILYLLISIGFFAYLQVSLNDLWRTEADPLPGQAPRPKLAGAMPPRLEDDERRQPEEHQLPPRP
jgi:hypothetical protein